MKKKNIMKCIDINSAYCPCILSETNHCVFCSHLQGKELCDCNWSGICILCEKKWQSRPSTHFTEGAVRIETEASFDVIERIAENTYALECNVPAELSLALDRVGAFVFLKNVDDPDFYHFPVGIMAVKDNKIRMVIEAIGPKSANLFLNPKQKLKIRGPYYNGIFGQPWIEHATCGKILLVAGGMGQPPAVPIAKKLIENKNEVTALLAPGKVGKIFIHDELKNLGVNIVAVDSLRRVGLTMLHDWIKGHEQRPDLVVSAGPDEQHYAIINVMHSLDSNIPMAATNNARMCCGEGICGACEKELANGEKVRACKLQTDFTKFKYE